MFSGYTYASGIDTSIATTWTWNGTNWTKLHPHTLPPARTFTSLVWDPLLGELVLFGGYEHTSGGLLSTTWAWNGTNWVQITTATSPVGRAQSAMAYGDAATGKIVLFGGGRVTPTSHTERTLHDTWIFDGTNWTQGAPGHESDSSHRTGHGVRPRLGVSHPLRRRHTRG